MDIVVGISVTGKAQFPSGTIRCKFAPNCTVAPTGKIPTQALKKEKYRSK